MALLTHMFRSLTIRRDSAGSPAEAHVSTREQLPVGKMNWDKVEVEDTGEVFTWCSRPEQVTAIRDGHVSHGWVLGRDHVVPRGPRGAWVKSSYDNRWELVAHRGDGLNAIVAVCETRAEAKSMQDLLVEAVRLMGGAVRTDEDP